MKMFDQTAPTRELSFTEIRAIPPAPGPARSVVIVAPQAPAISPTWLLLAFALGLLVSGLFR